MSSRVWEALRTSSLGQSSARASGAFATFVLANSDASARHIVLSTPPVAPDFPLGTDFADAPSACRPAGNSRFPPVISSRITFKEIPRGNLGRIPADRVVACVRDIVRVIQPTRNALLRANRVAAVRSERGQGPGTGGGREE